MARKKNKGNININTCADCELGEFDYKFENLSLKGKPTLIKCRFWQRKRIVSERACMNFKPKK